VPPSSRKGGRRCRFAAWRIVRYDHTSPLWSCLPGSPCLQIALHTAWTHESPSWPLAGQAVRRQRCARQRRGAGVRVTQLNRTARSGYDGVSRYAHNRFQQGFSSTNALQNVTQAACTTVVQNQGVLMTSCFAGTRAHYITSHPALPAARMNPCVKVNEKPGFPREAAPSSSCMPRGESGWGQAENQ
jgi:hypothetical protein